MSSLKPRRLGLQVALVGIAPGDIDEARPIPPFGEHSAAAGEGKRTVSKHNDGRAVRSAFGRAPKSSAKDRQAVAAPMPVA